MPQNLFPATVTPLKPGKNSSSSDSELFELVVLGQIDNVIKRYTLATIVACQKLSFKINILFDLLLTVFDVVASVAGYYYALCLDLP